MTLETDDYRIRTAAIREAYAQGKQDALRDVQRRTAIATTVDVTALHHFLERITPTAGRDYRLDPETYMTTGKGGEPVCYLRDIIMGVAQEGVDNCSLVYELVAECVSPERRRPSRFT